MHSKIRRRSFLSRLGAATTVGALATVTGGCDQLGLKGATEDAGTETSEPNTHFRPDTGETDADSGANADPVGEGRGRTQK